MNSGRDKNMKITVFNGSPRAERGNTHIMADAFLNGAKKNGAVTENIFLSKMKINHCTGCFNCWLKTPGKCIFNDDMPKLLQKVLSSDIIVFATPLYVDNVSGHMKQFMDRLIPLADPRIITDPNGEYRHSKRFDQKPPKIVVLSNCGFPEMGHFKVLNLLFKRIARNMHTKVIAEIYRSQGELLNKKIFLLKPIQFRFKKLMEQCGREIVENQKLSLKTIASLAKPLLSNERYVKEANKVIEKAIKKVTK